MRENKTMICPNKHGEMIFTEIKKKAVIRDIPVRVKVEEYVCETCGFEAGTPEQTTIIKRKLSDAYREKVGLLSGEQIKELRSKLKLSQQALAKLLGIGIASVKRWETGSIQNASMDKFLRNALNAANPENNYSGNRLFSIPRVKLIILEFEKCLGKKLLLKNDKFLYTAKYLWYADMLSFRELGKSITGSSYAALPYGPQVNNYNDLIDEIINTDETKSETLTKNELEVIQRIAKKFPNKREVYRAAHNEMIWKQKSIGMPIPYTDSVLLSEI
ncbi:MAG: DUF4065 domain-containing protein [Candidatus Marinimicrobia bacterium]|nr:DUF4065 domain-containing protein [Candidatus Neomarinimicrobiota bacterium]